MQYRYIPFLLWKSGEQKGLKLIKESVAKSDVFPLVTVTDETFADQAETIRSPAVPAAIVFTEELMKYWGARPFYLDASAIQPPTKGVHPFIETAARCREEGARLTPAIRLGANEPYEAAVIEVARIDKRGVALVVNLDEFNSAVEWMPNWLLAPEDTDLIVDLADNVEAVAALGSVLQIAFRNLHRAREWRTVTIAGTSMPENFADYARDGVHLIERKEWRIWRDLAGASLPYRLDYGDYATVPIRDQQTKYATGFPISVRYMLPTHFLIPRGVRTRGEGSKDQSPQLIAHANTIMRYEKRSRLDCWADDEIDRIARKEVSPNTLGHWVSIGVNRHITRVRTDLP